MKESPVDKIGPSDMKYIEREPRWAYLDGYNIMHLFWKKPIAAMCNRDTDPKCVQTTIDSFGGYPCIGDEYYECRVLPDGELMYPSKHPDLYNLLVQLASLEHIPFKPE